jgi:RNA recognition motif-containing protein
MKTVYVSCLPYSTNESDLAEVFASAGVVVGDVRIIQRDGLPSGFAFCDVADEDAAIAIEHLNGAEVGGRYIKVSPARPRQ